MDEHTLEMALAENRRLHAELAVAKAVKSALYNNLRRTLPHFEEYYRYDNQSDIDAIYVIVANILEVENGET